MAQRYAAVLYLIPMPTQSSTRKVYLHPLRLAREYREWSQRTLANEAGFTQAQISRLESGFREPRISTVRRLARALEVHPDAIFPEDAGAELRRALEEYFENPHRESQPKRKKAKR